MAGNVSVASGALAVTVDTTAPAAPSAPDLDPTDDLGTSNSDNITSRTVGLTFNGTSEANATVSLFHDINNDGVRDVGETILGSAAANGVGAWTIDSSTLAAGTYVVRAFATDAAGNESAASAGATVLQVEVDNTAPTVPAALNLAAADDTGSSTTDNLTKNTTGLTIDGTGENDTVVRLFDDADGSGLLDGAETVLATVTVAGGVWAADIALAASATAHHIKAFATDVAGNVSAASTVLDITVDTTANAPTALDLNAADDSGSSDADNITNHTTELTISGAGDEDGSVVTLFDDANGNGVKDGGEATLATATVLSNAWTADIALLTEGVHSIKAFATDRAGTVSAMSTALSITVDTTGPSVNYTGAYYDGIAQAITIAGTGFNSWGAATDITNIKTQLVAAGLTLDTNNDGSADFTLASGDIATAYVKDDNTLVLTLSGGGAARFEGTADFGAVSSSTGQPDALSISTAFAGVDTAGNGGTGAASGLALLGTQNQGDMPHTYSFAAAGNGATDDTLGEDGINVIDVAQTNFAGLTVNGLSASQVSLTQAGGGAYGLDDGAALGGTVGNSVNLIGLTAAFDTRVAGTGVSFADGSVLAENLAASGTLSGGTKNDQLIASDFGDRLLGNAGNDLLIGGAGADAIYGGTGADMLYGSGGNDYLVGGSGADTFIYTAAQDGEGQDVIFGFSALGGDIINVDGGVSAAALLALAHQSGGDTLITLNATESIRLLGVTVTDLTIANFATADAYIKGNAI